jgi:hypothetical protein
MKALLLAAMGALAWAAAAYAQQTDAEAEACMVAAPLARPDTALTHAAAALADAHRLNVAVAGTTSSLPPGPAVPAYPARLESVLASHLPGISLKVVNEAKPRQTASAMVADFSRILAADKPDLLIWQNGTFDAIKGIDPDEYRSALENGITELHAARTDVILMNMQYSPRTESMIAASAYADNMRWVALQQEVPLFDRFAIMKEWSDRGTFDFHTPANAAATAARVHDCLGRLLADFTLEAVKLAATPSKEPAK